MTRLVPGQPLDRATRKRLVNLVGAVSGGTDNHARVVAGERLIVLAPCGEVTAELVAFIDRVLALAVPHCPRCLDVSIGMCPPCRAEHRRELGAALAMQRRPAVQEAPPPAPPSPVVTVQDPEEDPARSCYGKHAYPSEVDANRVGARCFRQRGVVLRAYQCEVCGGYWHLTKQLRRTG